MNKIQILQLYVLKTQIKRLINEHFCLTFEHSDVLKRHEVGHFILDKLDLPKNNKNQILVRDILLSLGVKATVSTGVRIYRGIYKK